MLVDLLRDSLGIFLPKSRQSDGKKGLQRSDTCSTTTFGSEDESIEVQWHSPAGEKKIRRVPVPADVSDSDSDELGLPLLTKKGSKNLPTSSWYYSSNHIMVNNERRKKKVHPLTRKHELDATARWHAENMASANRLHHAAPEDLQSKIGRPCRVVGKNVAKGENVRAIHNKMMSSPSDVRNMCDSRYVQFGMATARGPDGELFLCQVFIG